MRLYIQNRRSSKTDSWEPAKLKGQEEEEGAAEGSEMECGREKPGECESCYVK